MEYVFGTKGEMEILKTKHDTHLSLTGFNQIERNYPDQTIIDNFRIVRKLDSTEDEEGNCYDWYEIDRHYRIVDKTHALMAAQRDNDEMQVDHEYMLTLMELGLI